MLGAIGAGTHLVDIQRTLSHFNVLVVVHLAKLYTPRHGDQIVVRLPPHGREHFIGALRLLELGGSHRGGGSFVVGVSLSELSYASSAHIGRRVWHAEDLVIVVLGLNQGRRHEIPSSSSSSCAGAGLPRLWRSSGRRTRGRTWRRARRRCAARWRGWRGGGRLRGDALLN